MNNEQQELLNYIQWLANANQTSTNTQNLSQFLQVYLWGVVSEVYELQAATPDKALLEASDVLAYAVLALVALGYDQEWLSVTLSNRYMVVEPPLQQLTNDLSKMYRGDVGNYQQFVEANLVNLVFWASTVTSVTPYILSVYNRQKLTARLAANNGSFQGTGDR